MGSNIDQFADGLLGLAEEMLELQELPRLVAEKAAPKLDRVIDQELEQGVGPRGQPWQPLKDGSGRIPFSSSSRMRNQIKVVPNGLNVKGKLSAPWNVHEFGSKNPRKGVPARPIYQTGELSPSWSKAVEEAAEEALEELTPKIRAAGK
jgi:hypothetical protein